MDVRIEMLYEPGEFKELLFRAKQAQFRRAEFHEAMLNLTAAICAQIAKDNKK